MAGWFLEKLKLELTIKSSNSTADICSKEMKAGTQGDICTPMFIAALFTIAKMSIKRWRRKNWYMHTRE
jgi:hypothetical protein